jgi:hypothetical protein
MPPASPGTKLHVVSAAVERQHEPAPPWGDAAQDQLLTNALVVETEQY